MKSVSLTFGTTQGDEITIEITKDNLFEMMEKYGVYFIAHGLLDKLLD